MLCIILPRKERTVRTSFGEVLHANKGLRKKTIKKRSGLYHCSLTELPMFPNWNGKLEYVNGRIIISNMVIVREDVTAVTGKLEVDGSVYADRKCLLFWWLYSGDRRHYR